MEKWREDNFIYPRALSGPKPAVAVLQANPAVYTQPTVKTRGFLVSLPGKSWGRSRGDTAPLLAPLLLWSSSSFLPLEPRTSPAQGSPWTWRPTLSASLPSTSPTQAFSSPSFPRWRWTGSQHTSRVRAGLQSSSKASCVWHSPGGVSSGGKGLVVARSADSPRGAAAGSWSVWRWSGGRSGPAQRKHCGCCEKPAWTCQGWSPTLGCRARGWCQTGTTARRSEEPHVLLATGKSSSHFAVKEGEEKGRKRSQVKFYRAEGNKSMQTMMLETQYRTLTLVSPGVVYQLIGSGQQFNTEILFWRDGKRRMKSNVLEAELRGLPVVLNVGLWWGLLDCKQTPVYCWGAYHRSRRLSGTAAVQMHRAGARKAPRLNATRLSSFWPCYDTFVWDTFTASVKICLVPLQRRSCPLRFAESVCLEQLFLHQTMSQINIHSHSELA